MEVSSFSDLLEFSHHNNRIEGNIRKYKLEHKLQNDTNITKIQERLQPSFYSRIYTVKHLHCNGGNPCVS